MADSGVNSIKALQQAVKAAQNDLGNYEKGTDAAAAAQDRLREATNRLRDAQSQIKASTQTTTELFSNTATSIAGFAGGIQAATGAMELFGIESSGVGEALVKFQALQGIVSGFTALSSGVKAANIAFKGFNATVKANPLVAIAAALLAVGTGIALFIRRSKKAEEETRNLAITTERLNRAYNEVRGKIDIINVSLSRQIKFLRANGADVAEVVNAQNDAYKEQIKILEDRNASLRTQINYRSSNITDEQFEELKKELEKNDATILSLQQKQQEGLDDIEADGIANRRAQREEAAKRAEEERKKAQQKELDQQKEFNERTIQIQAEAEDRWNEALTGQDRLNYVQDEIAHQQQLAEFFLQRSRNEALTWEQRNTALENYHNALNQTIELESERAELEQEITEAKREADEAEAERQRQAIDLANQLYLAQNPENLTPEEQIARYEAEADLAWQLANDERLSYDERIAAIANYNTAQQNSANLKKKLADEEKKLQAAQLSATAGFLSAASSLLGENTAAAKALSLSSAVISTWAGAAQVLANPLELNPYLKWIQFATTVTTGLGAVKNILKTDVPGASDSTSATVETPSYPSMPELSAPIQETHNNLGAFEEDFFNQTSRVILVESDVTGIQNRVKTAESEASF